MNDAEPLKLIICTAHAACFPAGWEAEHAAGPLALGNGPCVLIPDSTEDSTS